MARTRPANRDAKPCPGRIREVPSRGLSQPTKPSGGTVTRKRAANGRQALRNPPCAQWSSPHGSARFPPSPSHNPIPNLILFSSPTHPAAAPAITRAPSLYYASALSYSTFLFLSVPQTILYSASLWFLPYPLPFLFFSFLFFSFKRRRIHSNIHRCLWKTVGFAHIRWNRDGREYVASIGAIQSVPFHLSPAFLLGKCMSLRLALCV